MRFPDNPLKHILVEITHEFASLFAAARSLPEPAVEPFQSWQRTCDRLERHFSDEMIRVAVVGTIKSGKSTFANTLLAGDYLKRGAGVVTSMVTRIRKGPRLNARLYFKSWDEINAELNRALVLFEATQPSLSQPNGIDIRRAADRAALRKALGRLDSDRLIENDTRSTGSVLAAAYLTGYDRVKDIIASEDLTRNYSEERFAAHQDFVGDDALAVYLKDILLEIDTDHLPPYVELADCQGSDSPNPLHLAMIQDYLLSTNLTIYVISSRTGLRQADLKFLSMIKRMGILDNLLFVVNCDFSEHDSLADLERLVAKIVQEVAMIKPEPDLYALSALFNLFDAQAEGLPARDRQRWVQWEQEGGFAAFTRAGADELSKALAHKLSGERDALLYKNPLERLNLIASGVQDWTGTRLDLLAGDAATAGSVLATIRKRQAKLEQISALIKSTLDGAVHKIQTDAKAEVDRFFEDRPGTVLGDCIHFIRSYHLAPGAYHRQLEAAGFSNTLYTAFQAFRQALDRYMTEAVTPEVVRFVREQEKKIKAALETIGGPYDAMVRDALAAPGGDRPEGTANPAGEKPPAVRLPDFEALRRMHALRLPVATAYLDYTARIKTEAIVRLGFYSLVQLFRRLLKKPVRSQQEDALKALEDGVARIKRETEKSIRFHFKDFKENIKFQYSCKLVEIAAATLHETLLERFQGYGADLTTLAKEMGRQGQSRERVLETLHQMGDHLERIREKLRAARGYMTPPEDDLTKTEKSGALSPPG